MKRLTPASLTAIAALVLVAAGDRQADQARGPLQSLAGTWDLIAEEVDGEKTPDPAIRDVVAVIDGDRWTLRNSEEVRNQAQIRLNPQARPAQIDLVYSAPEGLQGKTGLGIYAIDGDSLKICLNLDFEHARRPTDFVSRADSRRLVRAFARQKPPPAPKSYDVRSHYRKSEHMIPMRDGVKLYTVVYRPRRQSEDLPFLLFRTPYGVYTGPEWGRTGLGPSRHSFEFENEGFLFVEQDVRGQNRSEGEFTVMRPFRPGKTGRQTDESSDTYDTIEWLLRNVPHNNGRVGMIGTSYPGFQVVQALLEPHPALRCASPQASPSDMFIGDDFHHNGAFRLAYTFAWLAGSARARKGPGDGGPRGFRPGTPDGYRFFLEAGTVGELDRKYFHGDVPAWNEYMAHPDYDDYWQQQCVLRYLKDVKLPVLHVAGWFDAEDFYGPLSIYQRIQKTTPDNQSYLVVGPFSHGGWNGHPDGNSLGNIRFSGEPAVYFREKVQFPFFLHYLKDKGEWKMPRVLAYETGTNKWRSFDSWPPRGRYAEKNLYLRAGGKLSFTPPAEDKGEGFDSYLSDPAKPVPATAETRFGNGHLWMVEDQRFAATRPDVLVYQTDELAEDLTVSGPLIAKLFVASSGTDADFVVKLIDVYPGDARDNRPNPAGVRMGHFQMLLSGEVFRTKYRKSYSRPDPLVPTEPTALEIDLRDKSHRFLKGHRVMVQIQSSWFPVIDRNPQVFTDIYHARESDFRKATQTVFRARGLSSHVVLPVVENMP
jgi:putative CocE/NonD family hydrolase